ncbi:MAG TPA: hypothetical protein VEX68_16515 [Bryobacteraceae bacterium]|nr:hypothetical protein [Bryobacteraceae bacterium]
MARYLIGTLLLPAALFAQLQTDFSRVADGEGMRIQATLRNTGTVPIQLGRVVLSERGDPKPDQGPSLDHVRLANSIPCQAASARNNVDQQGGHPAL